MRGPSDSNSESGFTLVELVVCLGLLALMAGLMAEGLSLVRRGGTLLDRVEAQDEMRAARDHIRRTIADAVPVFSTEPGGTRALIFHGEADRLRFISHAHGRLEGGGFVSVEFRVERHGGTQHFVTERQTLNPTVHRSSNPVRILVEDVERVGFRYFGRASNEPEPDWHSEWHHPSALPRLVEVTIAEDGEQTPLKPPIVIGIPTALSLTN